MGQVRLGSVRLEASKEETGGTAAPRKAEGSGTPKAFKECSVISSYEPLFGLGWVRLWLGRVRLGVVGLGWSRRKRYTKSL